MRTRTITAARVRDGPASRPAELVGVDALKAVLPSTLGSMKLKESSGSQTTTAGMGQTVVHVDYQVQVSDDEVDRGTFEVTDSAGTLSMLGDLDETVGVGLTAEAAGHPTRTFDVAGHKAVESWSASGRRRDLKVIVDGRSLVTFSAEPIDEPTLTKAAEGFDFKKLTVLAK